MIESSSLSLTGSKRRLNMIVLRSAGIVGIVGLLVLVLVFESVFDPCVRGVAVFVVGIDTSISSPFSSVFVVSCSMG